MHIFLILALAENLKIDLRSRACESDNCVFPDKHRPTQYSTGHLLIARHTSSLYVGNKNKFDASGFSSEPRYERMLFLVL